MAKVGADRRDAPFLRRSLPAWRHFVPESKDGCGEPSLPLVDGGRTSKEGFVFWLGVIDRMI
jgi:hypothetical protein